HEACSEVISCSLALHRHLLSVSAGHVQLCVTDAPQPCFTERSLNQILHVFLRPAL
ncbi:hypothetical protein M9458_039700, partial [Cirrhinus mrigala]